MAHKMAFASPLVKADMIESAEFPHLANRYGVMSVPRVFLNEKTDFTGALPEKAFLNFVLQAAEKGDGEQKSS
jgi:predicted DsbA family dithiol-disulfide isomerase